ncbi:hypothetical protein EPUS_03193 [Endocarpon pusillum Z07020]|uniref:Uncharacterized protein n=1 Tax=Endocarpon pusillum (strain Z07020 / HMAS-L-300199) TaxID=1263415 RepID=U1HZ38_ENDPU|nr:uncharacterized protein EPUS_03193 [Endocarpon pusillum Z07020]ERF74809.1 hypothetical protein EPUS_03193 [Endocarpon pusillum Z07020]
MEQQRDMESCRSYAAVEASLPRLSSILYFRSPRRSIFPFSSSSSSSSTSSFSMRDSMAAPTPRKMAALGGITPTQSYNRRCSSIPRPTSKLTAAQHISSSAAATGPTGNKAATDGTPPSIVKPRTYSRTRRNSFVPPHNDPQPAFRPSRARPPRSSLPETTSQPIDGSHGLSGIHQQMHVTCCSRHSLASLDAMVLSATGKAENKSTSSLPGHKRRTKHKALSSVTKVTSPVIPQRQLMGPLGPPLPRSQTAGNMTCFTGSAANTPSPSKPSTRTISTVSQTAELSVVDALAESRMTDKEIEYFNQVAKEVEANRQRMKGSTRAKRLLANDIGTGSASSRTLTSLTRSNGSFDLATEEYGDMTIADSSKKLPFQGARLRIVPNSSSAVSPPILTPDSGVSMGSGSHEGKEINVKVVHNYEPVQYWHGRFSALCDRLRSEDYFIGSSVSASIADSPCTAVPRIPKIDNSDSFEADDLRRSLRALKELRSYCRTPEAVGSFEEFAQQIDESYEKVFAAKQPAPFHIHSSDSKARLFSTGLCPKVPGLDKNIAAAAMRMINTNPKPNPSMTRSKTTGDMGQIETEVITGTNRKHAKVGRRRPSYLKAQEEVLVGEMGALSAGRRARAAAAAQQNARRRTGISSDVVRNAEDAPQGKMPAPVAKQTSRHSMPRKSSASSGGPGTGGEMLKRVFSESVRSVRRMGRSLTGLSGSGDA